ncbi:carbohydrate kinase family protein [Treponema zioleckii]|uniref:carbohydrate kinase family protein n=1 Tax=Treponema zioleckii TaxID=331680 RepID=UPI001F5B80A6|nr:carbohydrate kinase family protein [Treponema zioleckii]
MDSKVLCVGNVSVDIKAYSPEEDDNEGYRDGTIELVPGGVGRGMAINLKHLGLDTYIYSVVGNDIFGDYLRHGLAEAKINTELLRTSSVKSTALFSVMASIGKRASCIYDNKVLQEIVVDESVKDFIKKNKIDTIVMDSNLSPETLHDFYELKKENPEMFFFQNATSPDIAVKTLEYAKLIDLFACNEFEAQAIIGEEPVMDLSTAEKFRELGFKNFIITFGERGVMVVIGEKVWIEPPYNTVKIVDTIGAGDAFASGFLMGFLNHENVKRCIHYGLVCAKETLLTRQTVSDLLSREFVERLIQL